MTLKIDVGTSDLYIGDCRDLLAELPEACVQTCVTSPPYWGLRDYGHPGQIGLESTPELYVAQLVDVFRGVRRALRDDGTLWLNLGDSYAGSGRGGYAGGASTLQGSTDGQDNSRVAKGSQKSSGFHATQVEAGSIGRAWVAPPAGIKHKDLVGIPWMVAFALRADGWYLRQDIIWAKPNPMPESVTDRCTKAHEYLFLLSKSKRYYFDAKAIAEPMSLNTHDRGGKKSPKHNSRDSVARMFGETSSLSEDNQPNGLRNLRSVWTVATQPYDGAHFATFPPNLIEPCILAGSRPGDLVLDPFFGSGTTGQVAEKHGRRWIGFDINPEYVALAKERTAQRTLPIAGTAP